MPNCIWVFDLMRLCQTALITQSSYSTVKFIKWNPIRPEMFVFLCIDGRKSTSSTSDVDHRPESGPEGYVYLWNGRDVEAVQVPAGEFLIFSFLLLLLLWKHSWIHAWWPWSNLLTRFLILLVNFTVSNLEWNSDGMSLVLMDKDKYCVSYLIEEEMNNSWY